MIDLAIYLACVWMGAFLGIAVMALCAISKDDDWQ